VIAGSNVIEAFWRLLGPREVLLQVDATFFKCRNICGVAGSSSLEVLVAGDAVGSGYKCQGTCTSSMAGQTVFGLRSRLSRLIDVWRWLSSVLKAACGPKIARSRLFSVDLAFQLMRRDRRCWITVSFAKGRSMKVSGFGNRCRWVKLGCRVGNPCRLERSDMV
jgi:hypothetical protein